MKPGFYYHEEMELMYLVYPDGKMEVLGMTYEGSSWTNSSGSYDPEALEEISNSKDFLYIGI